MVTFRIFAIGFSVVAVVLWFSLPSTSTIGTFGKPNSTDEMTQPEHLLRLLQEYNDVIVRIIEVLHWLIFSMVFWLIASMITLGVAGGKIEHHQITSKVFSDVREVADRK